MAGKTKTKRGRPVTKQMPEKIDRDPEEVAEKLMKTPIKEDYRWRYMEKKRA